MKSNISVLILTLNEERNLERCLQAVPWSDDIVVFDSFSTDRTVQIAERFGARVFQRAFDDERSHRTASLQVPFKHRWVFNPDADEVATAELSTEMQRQVASADSSLAAFRMRRKDMYMGKWLRHSSLYPTWFARLFRPDAIRFERTINLNYVVDGSEGRLQNHLTHYSFEKGLDEWLVKHNKYSRAEAMETIRSITNDAPKWRSLLDADPVARRKVLKDLSMRVPCRPFWRFLYMYFVRRGILDGPAGFHYCMLLTFYEYMISSKVRELKALESQRIHG